jgi:hypothetical protein
MTNLEMQNKYAFAYTSVINKGYVYDVYVVTFVTKNIIVNHAQ